MDRNFAGLLKLEKNDLMYDMNKYFENQYSTKKYYIEYRGFLTNHISHGMIALMQLNSDLKDIKLYMKYYENKHKLETINMYERNNNVSLKPVKVGLNDLNKILGKRTNFYGIYNLLEMYFMNEGTFDFNVKKFINKVFPWISNGMSGALLHTLIHTGYGIASNNYTMILEGLSYLVHSHLKFEYDIQKYDKNCIKHKDVFELFTRIKREEKLLNCLKDNYYKVAHIPQGSAQNPLICLSRYGSGLIQQYMDSIFHIIPLIDIKSDINIETQKHNLFQFIVNIAVKLYVYAKSIHFNDFVLLHGVTGVWSLLNIIKLLDNINDINNSILQYISILIALYPVQFSPDLIGAQNEITHDKQMKQKQGTINWVVLIKDLIDQTRNDISNHKFTDEHVYKIIGVLIDFVEMEYISQELCYYGISKALQPLIIKTIASENNLQKYSSKM